MAAPPRIRGVNSSGRRFPATRASPGFCRSLARTTASRTCFIEFDRPRFFAARRPCIPHAAPQATTQHRTHPPRGEVSMNKKNLHHADAPAGTEVTELERLTRGGASRREVLRALAAAGMASITGAGLLSASGAAFAQEKPKQGGKIRVATQSASAADTLDPAKGALGTDYVRANMFYNGLTELASHLGAKMA